MNIKFFTMDLNNVNELKLSYKDLIKKHHPDVGGCTEDMKQINAEYEFLFNNVHKLGQASMTEDEKKKDMQELNDDYRGMVLKVAFLQGIQIDIVGPNAWMWVSGDTFQHAAVFKNAGFQWKGGKKAWLWFPNIDQQAKKFYRPHCKNLDAVKSMHGYTRINHDNNQRQLATA